MWGSMHSIRLQSATTLDQSGLRLGPSCLCAANRQEEFSCFNCLTFTPAGVANRCLIHVNPRRMKWSQQFKWIPGLSILFHHPRASPLSVCLQRVSARPCAWSQERGTRGSGNIKAITDQKGGVLRVCWAHLQQDTHSPSPGHQSLYPPHVRFQNGWERGLP